MATELFYIGVENVNLTNGQRNTLVAAIAALGQRAMYPFPIRNDNQMGIYEADFNRGLLLSFNWKKRLGTIFSLDPTTIDEIETTVAFGSGTSTVKAFYYLGTEYIRVYLFGTVSGSWEASKVECRGYLSANAAAWM